MRLVEVVVVLVLGALLVTGVWRGAAAVRRDGAALHGRAAHRDALRVANLVLDMEASGFVGPSGRPGEVAVRAHRWWGIVCDSLPGPGTATLRWRGLRRPDPAKDSIVVIAADGVEVVRGLDGVGSSTACGGSALRLYWTPAAHDPDPRLIRGFERGAYRVDDAVRYRRGRGGAQPLTASRFDPDSAGLDVTATGIRLRMDPRPSRWWPR